MEKTMTPLDTVAAQRDALSMKNRELARQLDAANAEIARLKGGSMPQSPASHQVSADGASMVPVTRPVKASRPPKPR